MMRQCVKITVQGTVQGVGYREYVKKYAEKFSIEGTVKNSEDGSVELFAAGTAEKLDAFIDYVYRGSARASITEVMIEAIPLRDFRGVFRVIGVESE